MGKAREFLDFWITNSVHAAEHYGSAGASQTVSVLAGRCLEMAQQQGLTKHDLEAEVGDVAAFIREKLKGANVHETDRLDRHRPN